MSRHTRATEYTVSVPIETTLKDGTKISGTMNMHASRRGSFEVRYGFRTKTDDRSDYTDEAHMRAIAHILLRELGEEAKSSGLSF